jgi:hypothetical protein
MHARRTTYIVALVAMLMMMPAPSAFGLCGAGTAGGNLDGYDGMLKYMEIMTGDILKLLPTAMGSFIYNNREDFGRGMSFVIRDIESNPLKQKDFEEVRRGAYARLSRDIPYCAEAFKDGELKMDTAPGNLAGRLGMIAYSIMILKMPTFPDLTYQERFCASFTGAVKDSQTDIWLFYDGYGDFHSLGELMERLNLEGMPSFRYVRNDHFAIRVKDDPYFMFRYPDKFEPNMVVTSVDINDIYNSIINNILDAYVYIWKCSGMDLAHPSYAAPPGTVISRTSRRAGSAPNVESLGRQTPLPRGDTGGATVSAASGTAGTESATAPPASTGGATPPPPPVGR